jgi:hypothetical protein
VSRKTSGARSAVDPDETVTYDATPPRLRGARVLCVAAGIALVAHHLLVGVLATPFFGGEAFVWGNVLGAFVLSLGVGMGAGDLLGRLAGGTPRGPWRLTALAGALVVLAAWVFPRIARAVLDGGPDSPFAPAAAFAVVLALPGIVLASIIPSVVAAGATDAAPAALARSTLRRFSLSMLGGVAGLAIASFAMRHADSAHVWLQVYALGGALLLLGFLGLGKVGKAVAAAVALGLAALVSQAPSEIQDHDFESALTEAFVLRGVGRYYASTAPEHVLDGTEIERRLAAARRRLEPRDQKIAVLLVAETLRSLGPLNISGSGLRGLFEIHLPEQSKPLILPFVDKITSVRSDGKKLHFMILRSTTDGYAHFEIPGPDGAWQQFTITSDFDVTVSTPDADTTKLEIGPQTVETGIFNDTIKTPFVCKNVALWIDACLLSLAIENKPDRVILRAAAQASVGKIQTKTLQTIDKLSPR